MKIIVGPTSVTDGAEACLKARKWRRTKSSERKTKDKSKKTKVKKSEM
jgi:hypothetical protein